MSGNEAVEIGLWHVNQEAVKPGSVTQVVLIGDMPPNTREEVEKRRANFSKDWSSTPFRTITFYKDEIEKLQKLNNAIPIHTFYVESSSQSSAPSVFKEISSSTKGEYGVLNVGNKEGIQTLEKLFGNKILSDVAKDDETLREDLIRQFSISFNA